MLTKLFVALYLLGLTAVMAGPQSSNAPGCVSKCWENTQYVSTCAGDNTCLCEDAEFQNAVFQCLYSQCPTAMFGSALHHTLSMCSASEKKEEVKAPASTAPALLRQQGLRKVKRDMPMRSVSVSVSVPSRQWFTQTQSVNRPTSTRQTESQPTETSTQEPSSTHSQPTPTQPTTRETKTSQTMTLSTNTRQTMSVSAYRGAQQTHRAMWGGRDKRHVL